MADEADVRLNQWERRSMPTLPHWAQSRMGCVGPHGACPFKSSIHDSTKPDDFLLVFHFCLRRLILLLSPPFLVPPVAPRQPSSVQVFSLVGDQYTSP